MVEAWVGARRDEPEGLVVDDVDHADAIHLERVYGPTDRSARRGAGLHLGPTSWRANDLSDTALGDAYSILGVAPGSDDDAIATAYRALARRHHPDIAGEGGTARMIRLNAAFDLIRTAERRAEYDREHGLLEWTTPGTGEGSTTARVAPGHRPDAQREVSLISAATKAGRSARSPAWIRATWPGSRISAKGSRTSRRSIERCAPPGSVATPTRHRIPPSGARVSGGSAREPDEVDERAVVDEGTASAMSGPGSRSRVEVANPSADPRERFGDPGPRRP